MTWEGKYNNNWSKHYYYQNIILKNRIDIIKKYRANIPIKEIAEKYKVPYMRIWDNLKIWDEIKKHGIKYLLAKCLIET